MKSNQFFILIFAIVALACKQAKTIKPSNKTNFNLKKSAEQDTLLFQDTFFVNKNEFRLKSIKVNHNWGYCQTSLQRLVGNKWMSIELKSEHGQYDDFKHNKDVNGDGFNDITNDKRFTQEVYFFNPVTNLFLDTSFTDINPDWILLDKNKQLFCDFQSFKGMSGQIHSSLYTFKNYKRYELYNLELWNENDDSSNLIPKFILNKCINGSADSLKKVAEILLAKPIDTDADEKNWTEINGEPHYFDYVSF